jgi:hypothetical protein
MSSSSQPSPAALGAKDVVARTVAGETLLVPVRQGVAPMDNIYLLNPVAAFLWQHLDGRRDMASLCELVRGRFAVPAERDLRADVAHFLEQLQTRGLATSA